MSIDDRISERSVPGICQSENVARAITTSTEARHARNGNVPASVFTYYGHSKISVERIDRMEKGEAARHGDDIAAKRGANRTFYGWAVMAVSDVREEGCDVEAAPEPDNDWHAHIVMPRSATSDDNLHDEHAGKLARRAAWQDKPSTYANTDNL